ncbi:MAG: antitoxin family protein [Myxococcota bacterium]
MAADAKRVRAVFAGGVFRPLEAVSLPENSEVELAVLDAGAFDAWWEAHIARVRARGVVIAPDEVDRDVAEAVREARAERRPGA